MKKIVVFLLAIIMISSLGITVFALGGEEISPYYVPIILTTQCSNCKNPMTFVAEIPEYSTTVVASCENSQAAHNHNFKHYYNHYACARCGIIGRIFSRTTMQCVIGMNPYNTSHP